MRWLRHAAKFYKVLCKAWIKKTIIGTVRIYDDINIDQYFLYFRHIKITQTAETIPHWRQWYISLFSQCRHCWQTGQIARFMGPTWGPPGPCGPQMGPMLVPWTLLSGWVSWELWHQKSSFPRIFRCSRRYIIGYTNNKWPLLLAWFNFNSSMDKLLHTQ